jgi:CubicO group peptidase (beta-lactamase class C family)
MMQLVWATTRRRHNPIAQGIERFETCWPGLGVLAMADLRGAHRAPVSTFVTDLDALVAEAMREWKIPGLAIAVARRGEPAFLKAYGERDVEAKLPLTTETHFSICSITKTFTAVGLALLVDEGRLDWTKPVRDYIPEFRLHDAVATGRVTVRDLLCHHSGLPRHDWIWAPAAMRHLDPSHDMRNVFQYQNLGYLAAGIVAERISGQRWQDFTQTRLTDKLAMAVSFTPEELASAADAAVPYAMDGDRRLRSQLWPIRTTAAGGINTSIRSIANWLRFLLDDGEFEGRRLLSPTLLREMQMPRVHARRSEFAEVGDAHYGLGFGCHHYRGDRVLEHGGGWIGWSTLLTLVPVCGAGVVVLTNRDPSAVPAVLTYFVLDRLLGREPVPWLDRFRERRRKLVPQMQADRQARERARRQGTQPSHDLADYAGEYEHPGYGRMSIAHADGTLQWDYRGLAAALAHRHYDTFELPEAPERLLPDRLPITFATDREGNITSLSAPFEPAVKDIVFVRKPAGECMEPTFRNACVGAFVQAGMTHVVGQVANGELTLTPANQPTYRLRPYQGRVFSIIELDGFRVEFRTRADGKVDELIFHQPNGTFMARRQEDGEPA